MKDKNAVTVKPKKKKFVLPVILLAVAVAGDDRLAKVADADCQKCI